eukprot:Amastigsp_a177214_12.p4 type:complete len:117 gc:universal Amastigsp_a177214_12:1551-1201(-)
MWRRPCGRRPITPRPSRRFARRTSSSASSSLALDGPRTRLRSRSRSAPRSERRTRTSPRSGSSTTLCTRARKRSASSWRPFVISCAMFKATQQLSRTRTLRRRPRFGRWRTDSTRP